MTAKGEPNHRWRTIVVDPPWAFHNRWDGRYLTYSKADGKAKNLDRRAMQPLHYRRGAAAQYVCMTLEELAAMPLGDWAEDKAHVYIWTTNIFVVEAHDLCRAWGFEPKTMLTWVKPRLGMGTYFRNNTEHVVFGARGPSTTSYHGHRATTPTPTCAACATGTTAAPRRRTTADSVMRSDRGR